MLERTGDDVLISHNQSVWSHADENGKRRYSGTWPETAIITSYALAEAMESHVKHSFRIYIMNIQHVKQKYTHSTVYGY